MATVPNPRTWTVGEQVTATKLNADIRDSFIFFKAPPLAVLRKTSNQSIPSNSPTAITWESELIDRDGGHSTVTNTSRYTSQTSGYYHLRACVLWEMNTPNDPAWMDGYFRRNNSTIFCRTVYVAHMNNFLATQIIEGCVSLLAGDYVEVVVHTLNAPGALPVSSGTGHQTTSFEIRWIGSP